MLDFFSEQSFDKDTVDLHTGEVVNAYLSEGINPNEKIASIAENKGFNTEQIQRIIESSNIALDFHLQEQKSHPLAKIASVIVLMRGKPTPAPLSADDDMSDYASGPCEDEGPSIDQLFKSIGIEPSRPSIQEPKGQMRHRIRLRIEKLAHSKSMLENHYSILKNKRLNATESLVKEAQQRVMHGESLQGLYKKASMQNKKYADKLFPIVQHVLEEHGVIEKNAFELSPDRFNDLVSENLKNVIILNGDDPMYKSIDTIAMAEKDMVPTKKAIEDIESQIIKAKQERLAI